MGIKHLNNTTFEHVYGDLSAVVYKYHFPMYHGCLYAYVHSYSTHTHTHTYAHTLFLSHPILSSRIHSPIQIPAHAINRSGLSSSSSIMPYHISSLPIIIHMLPSSSIELKYIYMFHSRYSERLFGWSRIHVDRSRIHIDR